MAQNQNNRNYNGAIWRVNSFWKPKTPNIKNNSPSQNKQVQLTHRPSLIKKIANDFEYAIAGSSAQAKEFARKKDSREQDQSSHIKKITNEFESAIASSAQTREFARKKDGCERYSDFPAKEIVIVYGHDNNAGKPVSRTKLAETEEVVTTVMSNEGKFLGYMSMVKKRIIKTVSSIGGGGASSRSKDSFKNRTSANRSDPSSLSFK